MDNLNQLQVYYCEAPKCKKILSLYPPNSGYKCEEHKKEYEDRMSVYKRIQEVEDMIKKMQEEERIRNEK